MLEARRQTGVAAALAVVVAVLAFAFRYLSNPGFSNDHFVHLARAQQMLLGGWPVRDFVDPGLPLMYAVSAIGLRLFGHTQVADSVIAFGAIGVAAGLSFWLAWRGGAPLLCAAIAVALQVFIGPRSYSYPKLFLYAVAIAACWRLIDRPTLARAALLGAVTAVAFLFRHDHGLFIGVAALIALAATPRAGWPFHAAAFVATAVFVLTPWAAFVHATQGLPAYFQSALDFSRAEAKRTAVVWPSLQSPDANDNQGTERTTQPEQGGAHMPAAMPRAVWAVSDRWIRVNAAALVFYGFVALPLIFLIAIWRWMPPVGRAPVVVVAVLALLIDAAFLRDPLMARLPDVAMPQTLLAAWAMAWGFRRAYAARGLALLRPAVTVLVLIVAGVSVDAVGNATEQVDRVGSLTPPALWRRTRAVTADLAQPYAPRLMPSAASGRLVPVFEYLKACTRPRDRFLYYGFGPEMHFYAARGFAGGQVAFLSEYYTSDEEQRLTVKRMTAERVPIVLIPADRVEEFDRVFPIVARYIHGRYQMLGDVPISDEGQAHVLFDPLLRAGSVDQATGWPCFL